jgi:hypothetical protein
VDLLLNSRFSFICLKIARLQNRVSILLAHDIRLFIEKQLLTFRTDGGRLHIFPDQGCSECG